MKNKSIKLLNPYLILWVLDRHISLSRCLVFGKFGFIYFYLINKISYFFFKKKFCILNLSNKYKFLFLYQMIFFNFIFCLLGVFNLYSVELHLIGIGFKINFFENNLKLTINFSHSIVLKIPNYIKIFILNKDTILILKGINKKLLGDLSSFFRVLRKFDIYKGKGIRYSYEILKLKEKKKN